MIISNLAGQKVPCLGTSVENEFFMKFVFGFCR